MRPLGALAMGSGRPSSRRPGSTAPLVLLAAILMGSDCEEPVLAVPPHSTEIDLIDPGPHQQDTRSQPTGGQDWNGRDPFVYVQMTSPVTLSGGVSREVDNGQSVEDICIVLSGGTPHLFGGGKTDSFGLFAQSIVPATYDLVIAPGCLTGNEASRLVERIVLQPGSNAGPMEWSLPEAHQVDGQISDTSGSPIVGGVVTVYRSNSPDLPLGVATTSSADGSFVLMVPEGTYDLVISSPADGSVPIPPIRIRNQALPLELQGLRLSVEYPVLPIRTVRGALLQATGDGPIQGRVRLEGWIPSAPGESDFNGGLFRAEFETEADGTWSIEVPRGSYTATAYPRIGNRDLDVARTSFDVSETASQVDVDLRFPDSRLGVVTVLSPTGNPRAGSSLSLRSTLPPHYAYQATTGADGSWAGLLPAGNYIVDAIPPPQPETGQKEYARATEVLDLTEGDSSEDIVLRRSDLFDGFVYTVDQVGVGSIRVLMVDPDTGDLWDEVVTNTGEYAGYFQGILPR
ncbi:MAG: hypothetical protein CL928_06330 [Deltaproteobacteria bacterium]|nr:hypothetical protein [Deltaproteobacteria bacterium]